MKSKKIIIGVLILISFCIASFFSGVKYNSNQKLNQDRTYYLNHIYVEVDNTIRLLSSVSDWGNSINQTDVTVNPYRKLLTSINSMKIMSEQAYIYMGNEKNRYFLHNLAESFDLIGNCIGGGVSYNNQLLCNDFLNDGILSKNEISFLTSLKQDLQNIRSNLYSEETKQENPNLSMENLTRIVKPFTYKYSISNLSNIRLKN